MSRGSWVLRLHEVFWRDSSPVAPKRVPGVRAETSSPRVESIGSYPTKHNRVARIHTVFIAPLHAMAPQDQNQLFRQGILQQLARRLTVQSLPGSLATLAAERRFLAFARNDKRSGATATLQFALAHDTSDVRSIFPNSQRQIQIHFSRRTTHDSGPWPYRPPALMIRS